MKRSFPALALVLVLPFAAPVLAADAPSATVADLAWMTGHWEGETGQGTLEENWVVPTAGTMASLVRATGDGATNMIELIVIEEEEGSLTLRLQQWDPGFKPRSEGPQVMRLIELSERKVVFEATGDGGLQRLGYSRPADDEFVISIKTAGGEFDIPLKSK